MSYHAKVRSSDTIVAALRAAMDQAQPLPLATTTTAERRMVRQVAGVSQEEAAWACATSLRGFIGWENGEHRPRNDDRYSRLLAVLDGLHRWDAAARLNVEVPTIGSAETAPEDGVAAAR